MLWRQCLFRFRTLKLTDGPELDKSMRWIFEGLGKIPKRPSLFSPFIFSIVNTRPGLAAAGGTDGGDPDPHD